MKKIITLLAILSLSSCANFDVMVDKSQLKSETLTHAIYPSTAVIPIVNADSVNVLINDSLRKATK